MRYLAVQFTHEGERTHIVDYKAALWYMHSFPSDVKEGRVIVYQAAIS